MKKLTIWIMLILALSSLAIAFMDVPYPVAGRVIIDGAPATNIPITIVNLRTGESLSMGTDTTGWYIFTLNEFGGYDDFNWKEFGSSGDTFEVRAVIGGNVHVESFELDEEVQIIDFIVGEVEPVEPVPEPPEPVEFQCWDGTWVLDRDLCPEEPEPVKECPDGSQVPVDEPCPEPVPVFTCPDGTIVEDLDDCPEEPFEVPEWIVAAIAGIILLVLGLIGIRKFREG